MLIMALHQKEAVAFVSISDSAWISALERPASQKIWQKLMTAVAAATTPKSSGVRSRARIRRKRGDSPLEIASDAKDHFEDEKILNFKSFIGSFMTRKTWVCLELGSAAPGHHR